MDAGHVHSFWGFSPALDLCEIFTAAAALNNTKPSSSWVEDAAFLSSEHEISGQESKVSAGIPRGKKLRSPKSPSGIGNLLGNEEKLVALQVASSDPRHTIATICRAWRWNLCGGIELHIHETEAETIARHMLLTCVFFDESMLPKERVELFLEIYANTLVREKTAAYVEAKGRQLEELVDLSRATAGRAPGPPGGSGASPLGSVSRIFDVSQLKYRECDALVEVFRSWSQKVPLDIVRLRDTRMRQHYADRYDARINLADWDYSMVLGERASIVNIRQFKRWRETGIAYEFRDCAYTAPNHTLSSMAAGRMVDYRDSRGQEKGRSVLKRGFWGDILNGPYSAFGVATEEKSLLRMSNKQHVFTASDVALHNLSSLLHEFYHREPHPPLDRPTDSKVEVKQSTVPPHAELATQSSEVDHSGGTRGGQEEESLGEAPAHVTPPCEERTTHGESSSSSSAGKEGGGDGEGAAMGKGRVEVKSERIVKDEEEQGQSLLVVKSEHPLERSKSPCLAERRSNERANEWGQENIGEEEDRGEALQSAIQEGTLRKDYVETGRRVAARGLADATNRHADQILSASMEQMNVKKDPACNGSDGGQSCHTVDCVAPRGSTGENATPCQGGDLSHVRVVLHMGELGSAVTTRSKFQEAFNVITLGTMQLHQVGRGLEKVAMPGGVLALEGTKFLLWMRKEQRDALTSKFKAMAASAGWKENKAMPATELPECITYVKG